MALALAARDAGYDVHVATPDGAAVTRIRDADLQWHRVRFGPMRRKPWSDLQSLIDAMRLYREIRPQLVHHVSFKPILYGTIAARLSRADGVVNAMTGMGDVFAGRRLADRCWRAIIVLLFKTFVRHPAMFVIAQNREDLELMVEGGLVRREQTVLIRGSGVDPEHFAPQPRSAGGPPVVAFASRITQTKGIAEFAAAALKLQADGVQARFVVAGPRDDVSGHSIASSTFDAWLSEGVFDYLGDLDDVREVYGLADIVCLPSWGGEGVPKALIEAAACELPVVTTDVPGCRDIVRDGVNGFIVPPRTVEPLAGAIRKLIADPDLRVRMGKRGRQIVIEEFSLQHVIDATLALYAEVTSRRRAPRPSSRASTAN